MEIHTEERYARERTRFTEMCDNSPNRKQTHETVNMNGTDIERCITNKNERGDLMDIRNELKSYIVKEGMTMRELVDMLSFEYGWSDSVPNFSGKLSRGSLRYSEAVEMADVMGYDIVWVKRK